MTACKKDNQGDRQKIGSNRKLFMIPCSGGKEENGHIGRQEPTMIGMSGP